MKYFAAFASCACSSSSGYGSSRIGGARPGTNLQIAAITTAKNATYVRNCSDERVLDPHGPLLYRRPGSRK